MKLFLFLVLALAVSSEEILRSSDPDEYLPTPELILNKGYPAEEHTVVTSDGYKLKIHRIPHGKNQEPSANRPVVLIQHGLLDADSTFVINFPHQSLGFILADAGYDVWLGNMRGNTYGRDHVSLNPDQEEFWDFSWQDMSEKDLPAMIDYALEQSGQKNLIYVGHSQGTLIAFAKFIDPEMARKVKLFVALAPVAQLGNLKSPIRYLADLGALSKQQMWYRIFGKHDFLPSDDMIQTLADKGCNNEAVNNVVCKNAVFVIMGPSVYYNQSRTSVYGTHTPAGTSVKNMVHFAQLVASNKFQKYDFGSWTANLKNYGQIRPPVYDIKKVQVPVAVYWALRDWLAVPEDVQFLRDNLPHIVDDYKIDDWNHADFVIGTNTKEALYDRMVNLMSKF